MDRVSLTVDGLSFEMKRPFDFDWLGDYGKVFRVFDRQDSGNICFGLDDGHEKFFLKYAGAPTLNYEGTAEEAVRRMKNSPGIYRDLRHSSLTHLIEGREEGPGYLTVFEWAEGECLNAHWNFDRIPKYTHPASPNYRFRRLDPERKLECFDTILDFHSHVASQGYVAVDFYDGSIMYDFARGKTTICDIEFYRPGPFINSRGRLWGSSRFMSPEEFEKGALIDGVSNIYTMGAAAFELLGNNQTRDYDGWQGPEELFRIALRAVDPDRSRRYQSLGELARAWRRVRMGGKA